MVKPGRRDVDGRRVFRVCWPRYLDLREKMLAGRLRVSRKRDTSSTEGDTFSMIGTLYLADFDASLRDYLRYAAMCDYPGRRLLARRREALWATVYVLDWPVAGVAPGLGVSERHCRRMMAELEWGVGWYLWKRGFCGVPVDAKDFDPVLVYFGVKEGVLVETAKTKGVLWGRTA